MSHWSWPVAIALGLSLASSPAGGQTVMKYPSSTTNIAPSAGTFTINDGDNPGGGNLFHSFQEFSPGASTVQFNNTTNITHIFGRVINGSESFINGTIAANTAGGAVKIFLINPSGIRLDDGATLGPNTSFVGSTATSIEFPGGSFSALDTSLSPSLFVSVPTGLRFTGAPGRIRVDGTGHALSDAFHNDFDSQTRTATTKGMRVSPNQTLTLIGGDVQFQGGNVLADQGRLEIGSVGENAFVGLTADLTPDYSAVQTFGDITLTQQASIDASAAAGGRINVQGRRISISEGSVILSITQGAGVGQDITIAASEELRLTGFADLRPTIIATKNGFNPTSTGSGGNVVVNTPSLVLQKGAQLLTGTFDVGGDAGDLIVNADNVDISGVGNHLMGPSGLYARVANGSRGGDLKVMGQTMSLSDRAVLSTENTGEGVVGTMRLNLSDNITVQDGAEISASTFGTGNGGDIFVTTPSLNLDRGRLLSSSLGDGNAGNIIVNSTRVSLANLSEISTTAFLKGDAGNIAITASDTLSATGASKVSSQVESSATGNGGTVSLDVGSLVLREGSQVSVGTFGAGNGGTTEITVSGTAVINGVGTDEKGQTVNSGVSSQVNPKATGSGGTLSFNAQNLWLQNGGNLTAGTFGAGEGGNLGVNVTETIAISGTGNGLPSAIAARTRTAQNAGNLTITTNTLDISDRGTVTVESLGTGNAGNLTVNARYIRLNNNGSITGATASGQGGNLDLNAMHIIMLFDSEISTTAGTANQPGDGGNITIDAATVTGLFNSDIASNSFLGRGGRIVITAQGIFGLEFRLERTPENDITAFSLFDPQLNGEVVLNTPGIDPTQALIEVPVVESPEVVEQVCRTVRPDNESKNREIGSLRLEGRALPNSPTDTQGVSSMGTSLPSSGEASDRAQTTNDSPPPPEPPRSARDRLIAQGWGRNAAGELVLTAQAPSRTQNVLLSAVSCRA